MSVPHFCFSPRFLYRAQVSAGEDVLAREESFSQICDKTLLCMDITPVSAECGTQKGGVFTGRKQKFPP